MKKLNLEHLAVDSFQTAPGEAQVRGTVQAHGMVGTQAYNCTADFSCRQTCYGTACNYTVLCP